MNRMTATFGAVAIVLLAAACTQKTGAGGDSKSDNVAVIDDYKLPRGMYDVYVNTVSNGAANLTEQQRTGLLENLVRGQVLAREAQVTGVDKEDKVRAELELQRLNILSQAATANFLKDKQATDAEMRAEYDKRLATFDNRQYRASHILVKTEAEAKKIIAQLNAGGNFAAIARAQSVDTASKDKGGDLDWFSPSALVPEFSNAVISLGKGQTSAAPAQTEYGFHVIRVVDIRQTDPPSFEKMKDQMKQLVEAKKVKDWVEGLMKKAKITRTL